MTAEREPNRSDNLEPQEAPSVLRLATEGPSFTPGDIPGTSVFEARLGGHALPRPTGPEVPGAGSSPTPGSHPGQERHGHGLRNTLLAVGGFVAAGATVVGILGTRGSEGSQSDPNTSEPNGAPTQVVPETPNASVATPSAEITPTIEPTPSAEITPTIEPTPTPEVQEDPEGSHGNVESIDALHVPESQKEAIKKMLENATPQIIVEKDGQVVIVAISNSMLEKNSSYDCTDFLGNAQKCEVLKSVRLRTEEFPDAADKSTATYLEAKFQAWRAQTNNKTMTFNDFLASRSSKSFGFNRRARNVFSGEVGISSHTDESPVVMIVTDFPEPNTVIFTQAMSADPLEGNGVIGERIWTNALSIGNRDPKYAVREDFTLESTFSLATAQWSDNANLNVIGEGSRSGHATTVLVDIAREINNHSIPIRNLDHWFGITKIEGISSKN